MKEIPDEMEEIFIDSEPKRLVDLLYEKRILPSKSEVKRLIAQGGIKVNDDRINDINFVLKPEDGIIIRIGKRRFYRLRLKS